MYNTPTTLFIFFSATKGWQLNKKNCVCVTVCQQFSFIQRWLISSLIFVMSTVAPVHISLYEFLSIGGNGRQPHHQPYSLIRKSRPTNVIMHKANVCIISVSITRATYFIPSPVRNRLQSAHIEKPATSTSKVISPICTESAAWIKYLAYFWTTAILCVSETLLKIQINQRKLFM